MMKKTKRKPKFMEINMDATGIKKFNELIDESQI